MKKTMLLGIFGMMALSCYAAVPTLAVTITDGTNSVTTTDLGGCTVNTGAGSCGAVSITPGDLQVVGATLGSPVTSQTGATCKAPPSYAGIDVNIIENVANGPVTVMCSATGYSTTGSVTLNSGGGPASTLRGFVNTGNVVCTVGPCAGTSLGPLGGGGTVGGSIGTQPYSLTLQVALPNAGTAGNFNLNVLGLVLNTGCPATPGFWKNEKKHPFPIGVFPVTIGGFTYTSAAQFYAILNAPGGGNAVQILGFQLIAAILNIDAGGQTNTAVNNAIIAANSDLAGLVMPTSHVAPGSALGKDMITQATLLANYNAGFFGTCTDGTGLVLGP